MRFSSPVLRAIDGSRVAFLAAITEGTLATNGTAGTSIEKINTKYTASEGGLNHHVAENAETIPVDSSQAIAAQRLDMAAKRTQ